MARSQIKQDVGGVGDHELACLEEWRRERRRALPRPHHLHHRSHTVAASRHVGIGGASLFQRETDIFAATLNGRPVIELIAHRWISLDTRFTAPANHPLLRSSPCDVPASPIEFSTDMNLSESAWPC